MRAIPLTGAAGLTGLATRTTTVRILLLAALVACLAAAFLTSRHPHSSLRPVLPPQSGGVVVLDVSASISADTYARIHETLQQLVAAGGDYGLVVFSNTAYEALPPGTPASALEPIVRYFALPRAVPGEQPVPPVDPWTARFTNGTELSAGLDLARSLAAKSHTRHPSVLLISDLADDPDDLARLTSVLNEYQAAKIDLRAIALNADPSDLARFRGLARVAGSVLEAPPPRAGAHALSAHTAFPIAFVALALIASLLLAARELWDARLDWELR